MTEYEDIFSKDSSDLGKSGLLEHAIDTGDCKPVKQPPRRVPPYQREVIDQQLGGLLTTGRIEPSQSPWSSPVELARKHADTYLIYIDYRKLNQLTQKDAIPLPRTDDVLEALDDHEKNYCTTRLEMLALVTYVDYFRYYLLERKFCVRTDHHSLRWLTSFKEPQGRVVRWLERLQEYDFEIQHRPGKQHSNVDSLPRRPRRNHGDCLSCVPLTAPQIATVTSRMSSVHHQSNEEDPW